MNAVSGCFCLCGGTLAGTNSTCRSEERPAAGARVRQCEMSAMDGIEAAAEQADIHSAVLVFSSLGCPVSFLVYWSSCKACCTTMFPAHLFVPASFAETII